MYFFLLYKKCMPSLENTENHKENSLGGWWLPVGVSLSLPHPGDVGALSRVKEELLQERALFATSLVAPPLRQSCPYRPQPLLAPQPLCSEGGLLCAAPSGWTKIRFGCQGLGRVPRFSKHSCPRLESGGVVLCEPPRLSWDETRSCP